MDNLVCVHRLSLITGPFLQNMCHLEIKSVVAIDMVFINKACLWHWFDYSILHCERNTPNHFYCKWSALHKYSTLCNSCFHLQRFFFHIFAWILFLKSAADLLCVIGYTERRKEKNEWMNECIIPQYWTIWDTTVTTQAVNIPFVPVILL